MEKTSSQPALCSKSCSPMAASAGLGLSCCDLSFTLSIPLCTDLELLQLSSKSVQGSDRLKRILTPIGFLLLGGGLFVLLRDFLKIGFCRFVRVFSVFMGLFSFNFFLGLLFFVNVFCECFFLSLIHA